MRFQSMLSALPRHLAPDQLFDRCQAKLATVAMVVVAQMEAVKAVTAALVVMMVVQGEVVAAMAAKTVEMDRMGLAASRVEPKVLEVVVRLASVLAVTAVLVAMMVVREGAAVNWEAQEN